MPFAGNILKAVFCLCACLLLTQCTSWSSGWHSKTSYEAMQTVPPAPASTEFQQALYKEYMSLAEKNFYMGEKGKADFYAQRASMAADSDLVMPLEIGGRKTPDAAKPALQEGRARMIRAIAGGAQEKEPQRTARALASFDCWTNEIGDNDYIVNSCRDKFSRNIKDVETRLKECAPAPIQQSMIPAPFSIEDNSPDAFRIEY